MKNLNNQLRKANKEIVDRMKEESKITGSISGRGSKEYLKDTGVKPLTLKDQLIKGANIEVKFLNVKEDKPLSSLQLAVYMNGQLKYTSKKGVFTITTVKYSAIRRKGWRFYSEKIEKDRIIFKEKKDYDKFIGFCTKVRDCVRIQDMYEDLCFNFIKEWEEQYLEEDAN